ncbi:MAG: hypothetical protein ACRD0P_01865 [Stackebrandtia sp.]
MRAKQIGTIAGIAGATAIAVAAGVTVWWTDGADAGSPQDCRITDPSSVGLSAVHDVSPSGDYLLGSGSGAALAHKGSKPVNLSIETFAEALNFDPSDLGFPGADESHSNNPSAVNSDGTVVGTAVWEDGESAGGQSPYVSYYHDEGWRYRDGKITELSLPDDLAARDDEQNGGWNLALTDINEAGKITGYAVASKSSDQVPGEPRDFADPDFKVVPLSWQPGETEAAVLDYESDSDNRTIPSAIHDDGTIVGIEVAPGPADDSMKPPPQPHTVWSWSPDSERKRLPFEDLRFPSTSDEQFPQIAGDWLLVDNYRWKLFDGGKPEQLDREAEYGENDLHGLFVDDGGRIYGTRDGAPEVGVGGDTVELPVGSHGKPKDPDYELTNTSVQGVSADGSVVLGTHDYAVANGDFDSESFFWRCDV